MTFFPEVSQETLWEQSFKSYRPDRAAPQVSDALLPPPPSHTRANPTSHQDSCLSLCWRHDTTDRVACKRQKFVSHSSRGWSPRPRRWKIRCLVRVHRCLSSHCTFPWHKGGGRSLGSGRRALIPLRKALPSGLITSQMLGSECHHTGH